MKKTKFLLAAMALPMLFTACSQDELVENYGNQKGPDAEGFYATLNPTFDGGVSSRASWEGARLEWDETDKISVYWLANQDIAGGETPAKYQYNSIFKTTDGNEFTSESMVFVGGNVAVYPANVNNFIAGNDIVLKVPATQDVNTIKNIPYISNYLSVDNITTKTDNNAGYNNGIDAPMKMAANVFNLTFELKNTAGLSAYGFAVESVELHAQNAFAKEAKIVTDDRVLYSTETGLATGVTSTEPFYTSTQKYYNGSRWVEVKTITQNLWVAPVMEQAAANQTNKLTSTAITDNGDGTYTAQFVVLPTNEVVTDGTIVINTTCGHIDIKTPSGNGLVEKDTWIVKGGKFEDPTQTGTTVENCFTAILSDAAYAYTENEDAKFIGEKTGRIFPRSIVADMNDATLNNSAVYTSDDIIRYVNIYTKMGKTDPMNLQLSSKTTSTTFAGLTKAALAAVDSKNNYNKGLSYKVNVSLSANNVNAVEITNAGDVYDIKSFGGSNNVALVLSAGEWKMNDAFKFESDKISKIINKGTLTVNGTTNSTTYKQEKLAEALHNEGTLKIGGNNKLQVPGNLTTAWGSTTKIAAGQNLIFTEDITTGLYGTFDVEDATSFLTTATSKNVTVEGIINNWGTVAAEGGVTSNGFINKKKYHTVGNTTYEGGIINVKGEQAFTYIHDNAEGTINMSTRTDEIMVASALKGQIIYPYTAADGNTFTFTIDDRFNTVKFGNDVPNLTLVKELDLDGDDENDLLSIKDLSFIFTGTTTLKAAKANGFAIDKLTVNSGANLRITTGNELVVNDLANSGIITIGGYIYYKNTCVKGTVYSQGGAIKAYDSTSSVSYAQDLVNDAINEAIANGESTVTLDRNIELSEALVFQPTAISRTSESAPLEITLDLNGKTVKNDYGTVIKVSEGVKLTITGNGTVLGATTNQCGSQAVCADGGEVIIENGTFKVGGDLSYPANPRNDCIYITSNGGSITIEGGYFEYTGARVKENYQNDGRFFLLNDKDSAYASGDATMIVKAGTFVDFNPAANYAENGEGTTNFLDENSKVTEVKNANGIDETATYANEPYGKTWTLSRTYKVEVVED